MTELEGAEQWEEQRLFQGVRNLLLHIEQGEIRCLSEADAVVAASGAAAGMGLKANGVRYKALLSLLRGVVADGGVRLRMPFGADVLAAECIRSCCLEDSDDCEGVSAER